VEAEALKHRVASRIMQITTSALFFFLREPQISRAHPRMSSGLSPCLSGASTLDAFAFPPVLMVAAYSKWTTISAGRSANCKSPNLISIRVCVLTPVNSHHTLGSILLPPFHEPALLLYKAALAFKAWMIHPLIPQPEQIERLRLHPV
jgi:hypothetical protein